jgi:chromosomal replication initiation ATPase DnaA
MVRQAELLKALNLTPEDLTRKTRERRIVDAKKMLCFFLDLKTKDLAKICGYKDRWTVNYNRRTIEQRLDSGDEETLKLYNQLLKL